MDSAVGTSSNFFMDCVLIDSVMRASIIILVPILRLRIKSFLWKWLAEQEQGLGLTLYSHLDLSMSAWSSLVMPKRA
jgi:hypothetical protein